MKSLTILSLMAIVALSCPDRVAQRTGSQVIYNADLFDSAPEATSDVPTRTTSTLPSRNLSRWRRAVDVPLMSFQGKAYDQLLNDALSTSTTTTRTTVPPTTVRTTTKATKSKRKHTKKAIKHAAAALKKKTKWGKSH
ncbi:uncharacterized protein DMAD_06819 [Drosophila madeirensis]|uniref:Uncharacterized protein n=1 Tax=Drosophila madeirensis TaxID=30013 RepID=A0AAU9FRW6_DROMD